MRKAFALVAAVVVVALIPLAALAEPPKRYFVDEAQLNSLVARPGATIQVGIHAGAGYWIEVPANWNGDLVLWAHGYRGTGLALTVDAHPLRDYLLANGYAWAASSYSKNDYEVGQGVLDTHRLLSLFGSKVAQPDQVFITGASMGGHVTGVSVEQFPNSYDGAMAICGVMGDVELFDFFADFNLAGQALGGVTQGFPVADPATWLWTDLPQLKANLESVPGGWPLQLNQDGLNFKQLTELRSGGERPNFDNAWYYWNALATDFLFNLAVDTGTLPVNGNLVDNSDIVYQFDQDPALTVAEAELNMNILRMTASPQARHPNGLAAIPAISGDLEAPMLTLHNLGDLFVPFHNEIVYALEVTANGEADLLVQRAIRGVGHCDFTPAELIRGFADLVAWVENGVRPAGDIVLNPAVVASANYGCQFTSGTHVLGTPCP